jgi:Bacterial Ig-like domain (group 2)
MPDILDELSLDSWGGGEEEEEYFDEEYIPESWTDEYDDEASASEKRRRAAARARKVRRQRQLRAARQRRQRPTRPVRTAKAAISKTRDDLKEVALENEVKAEAIGGRLNSVARRTGGLENGAVATPAIRLAQDRIDNFLPGLDQGAQDLVKGALEYAPTIFLKAGRKQLIGLAAGAAVLIGAEVAKRLQDNDGGGGSGGLIIDRAPAPLPVGGSLRLLTRKNGCVFSSTNDEVATVELTTGVVTGHSAGSCGIKATLGTEVDVVPLTVTAAAARSTK